MRSIEFVFCNLPLLQLAEKVKEDGGKLVVGTDELELRVLEGEEEQTYLVKAKERFEKRRHLYQKKHGRKGGRSF